MAIDPDQWWSDLPLEDEDGYYLQTDENGDEILDDNSNPIRTGAAIMQTEAVTLKDIEAMKYGG